MKLTKDQIIALELSIQKWREIEDGMRIDRGTANCACCAEYYRHSGCGKCPVKQSTGIDFCEGTPYEDWDGANGYGRTADTPKLRRLARAEKKFLEKILKDGS